jgi:hypothetical protein
MKTIYVIGPVIRAFHSTPDTIEAEQVYNQIRASFENAKFKVVFPVSELWLEHASPRDFYEEIKGRINSSDLVITVLPEINPSADVESTMASFLEKEQYIFTRDINTTPRLLRGLPKVESVGRMDEITEILAKIKKRLNENENPPRMLMAE